MVTHGVAQHGIDVPETNITEHIFGQTSAPDQKPAFIDGVSNELLTYGELKTLSQRVATGIMRTRLRPGEVIAMVSPNSIEYAAVFHGVSQAGCSITPINPAYTPSEIDHQLADSGARIVFTAAESLETDVPHISRGISR